MLTVCINAPAAKSDRTHGSYWRVRCCRHGITEDIGETYSRYTCAQCGEWLRPDIIRFEDMLNPAVITEATSAIAQCDLYISIGTSGAVWPAASFPEIARKNGTCCIEIIPQPVTTGAILFRCDCPSSRRSASKTFRF